MLNNNLLEMSRRLLCMPHHKSLKDLLYGRIVSCVNVSSARVHHPKV